MRVGKSYGFAAALLAVLMLPSCGGSGKEVQNGNEKETTVATEAVAEETVPPSPVEEKDYGGAEFRVMTNVNDGGSWALDEFDAEETNGERLNDAVFARNDYIAEKFNIVFNISNTDSKFAAATNTIKAGDDAFDLILPGIQSAFTWGANGYLYEVGNIPLLNTEAEWWNKYVLAETSVAHKNYFLLGDINLLAYDSTAAFFFNKAMAEEYNVESPYELVRAGKWTFDKLMELGENVSEDVNGDGTYGAEDAYGVGINSYGALCMIYGSGACFAPKNTEDIPKITIAESTVAFFQKMVDAVTKGHTVMYGEKFGNERVTALQKAFKENRMLFYNEMLNRTSILRDMDADFGVLPLPKGDDTQKEYETFIHQSNSSVVCVPVTVREIERTGRILEDIAYESHYYLYPVYLETTVKSKYLRDEDSEEMVDILLRGIRYDLACVSGSALINNLRTMLTNGDKNIASNFESNRSSYEKGLADLTDKIAAMK